MRIRMLTATAAAALIACASPVIAQQERSPGGSTGASQRDEGGTAKNEGRGKSGDAGKSGASGTAESGGGAESGRMNREQNQDTSGQDKSGRKSKEHGGQPAEGRAEGSGQDKDSGQYKEREYKERESSGKSQERSGERAEPSERSEPGRAERSEDRERTGSHVARLDESKRKTVRERFEHAHTKRVEHADFNIVIGTVVPRSVELYDIPSTIVEIVPDYRSYKYVRVGDSILIIDPRSLEIVDVIPA